MELRATLEALQTVFLLFGYAVCMGLRTLGRHYPSMINSTIVVAYCTYATTLDGRLIRRRRKVKGASLN